MGISGRQKAPKLALFGTARFGATRFGYTDAKVYVKIAGTHYANGRASTALKILEEDMEVRDVIDETPNTLNLSAMGFTPATGAEVIVTIGSKNNLDRKFAGQILAGDQTYLADNPANAVTHCRAIDYSWIANNRKVTGLYKNQSASTIATAIVTGFTVGLTANHVAQGLATVDEISFTNVDVNSALTQLAKRIGAYWFWDYANDLHFGSTESGYAAPVALTSSHSLLRNVVITRDLSQIVTRVWSEGGGVNAISAVNPGETILPIEGDIGWYRSSGGLVRVNQQRIAYTGLQVGGSGTLVGPGASPSSGPVATLAAGSGLSAGLRSYAVTFVTGAGESIQGPLTIVSTTVDPPATSPIFDAPNTFSNGTAMQDRYYGYAVTFVNANGETTPGPRIVISQVVGWQMGLKNIPTGPGNTTARKLYRTPGQSLDQAGLDAATSTATLKLLATISDNTTTTYIDTAGDGSLGANAPTTNTATGPVNVALSGIGIGSASVTSRKIYRTVAGGSQLKLLTTIADNTATTYADSTADASLGANVPTSDTSGLTQPDGQVGAGSTSMIVAGAASFSATGGWAIIGNGEQAIRYAGISGSALTGLPASGIGAVVATVSYNSTITPAAALTGIPVSGAGAIVYPILKGDAVNVLAQVDSTSAQATLAALSPTSDGIREEYLQDNRLSETECRARGNALLALRSGVQITITYETRDPNTRSGATVHVDLPAPYSLTGDFKIQEAILHDFTDLRGPFYTVTASSSRFSFEDLIARSR